MLRNIRRVVALEPESETKSDLKPDPTSNSNLKSKSNSNSKSIPSTKKKKSGGGGKENGRKSTLCVVCSDEEANHIVIPCGHIAVGSDCAAKVRESRKCPFCGHQITNIIKCFHVGL